MQKTFGNIGMTASAMFLSFLGLSSCINEEYNTDKLNTEVTIAQSGLSLPIGSTDKLKIKDFVKDLNQDMLTQINGAYALKFSDTLDLSKNLPNLNEMLTFKDISFKEMFQYNIDNLKAEDLVLNALEFNTKFDTGTDLNTNIAVPQVSANEKFTLGLQDYVTKLRSIDLSSSFTKQVIDAKTSFTIPQIPPQISGDFPIPNSTKNLASKGQNMRILVKSPDAKITNIRDIMLDKNAKIMVKVVLHGHEFLTKGEIIPDININCGRLFGMKDQSGAPMSSPIRITKALSKANNFTTTEEISMTSLNVRSSDWINGYLDIDYPMTIAGTVTLNNAATSTTKLNSYFGNGEIRMEIILTFANVNIESATMDLNSVAMEQAMTIPISIGAGVDYPEQVKSIDDVVFDSNSNISIAMTPENLNIRNLNATVNSMQIKFPSAMKMAGTLDGSFDLGPYNIKEGINKNFGIEKITFPASPVPGKLVWEDVIQVKAQFMVNGIGINSADIPSLTGNDSAVNTTAQTSLNIENWHATIKPFENKLTPVIESFTQDIQGNISDFGTFTVTPEGEPQIKIGINMPATSLHPKAGKEGVKIEFPKFIEFRNVNPTYNYNSAENSITFKEDIPSQIVLNIDKLKITPEPKADGTGHSINGEFKLSGSIRFDESQIAGKDVEIINTQGISVNASIPQMKPATVQLSEFKLDINENFKTTLLKGTDIPAEIVSISEASLDNVNINLGLGLSGIPNFGKDKELVADLKVTLPAEIVLDKQDSRVEGNVLNIKVPVRNNMVNIAPVKVCAIDLSKYDFSKKEDITREISIAGKISVTEPKIDINQQLQPIKADITANIANIKFSKIAGKVDYAIEQTEQNVTLTDIPDFLKGENICLDIDNPFLLIKAKTNLGIPMKGSLSVLAVRNGVVDTENAINLNIALKGAADATKKDSTMYLIAAKNEGCPADYEFIECKEIKSLIKSIPDELKLSFNAGTSATEECVIEPGAKYTFDVDYSIVAPMAFGNDLKIEMADTLAGLGDLLPQLLKNNKIQLGGEIANTLPLQLEIDINLIDNNNQTIKLDTPARQTISACASDGSASVAPLELTLDVAPGADMKNFKGLLVRFKVTSGNAAGIPITEESYVQAKITAKLPEGATVDLKDFATEGTQNQTNGGK